MKTSGFEGIVKPLRRGGWSARVLLTTERHGQIFKDQIGPREFTQEQPAIDWLGQLAAERSLDDWRIVRS